LLPWLMVLLPVPGGGTVKIIERGAGPPVVFLHSGVGSAGEWREAFSLWPEGHHLVAVDAYRGGTGPGVPGHRTLDDYAGQVHAVVEHVGRPVHLIGFSWGGATALHTAATAPAALASVAVIEPEAYSLLKGEDGPAFAAICGLRDRWREYVRAGHSYQAFEEFVDFYNGPGSFARPVHVVEGAAATVVDRAIGEVLLRNLRCAEHSVVEGAGHMMPLTHAAELTRTLVRHLP